MNGSPTTAVVVVRPGKNSETEKKVMDGWAVRFWKLSLADDRSDMFVTLLKHG